MPDSTPLIVDMDGTFFASDSTELMTAHLRRHAPHRIPGLWWRVRRGDKAAMKLYLHRYGAVDVRRMEPYAPVHAWLSRQGARDTYLATGAPEPLAEAVARAYPLFAGVFGTVPGHNNTGVRKAARLVETFGERGFDYCGNSDADLAVWSRARRAIVCNAAPGLVERAREVCDVEAVL